MRNLMLQVTLTFVVSLLPSLVTAQQQNPMYTSWQNHEPGTVVTLHTVTKQGDTVISETKQTQKLVEITADQVTIEMGSLIIAAGQEIEGGKTTMTFQREVDSGQAADTQGDSEVNLTRGEETVEVNGEKFACTWVATELEIAGSKTTSKVWTSTEVPGLNVKSIVESAGTVSETTLLRIDKP